ncbi:Ulp1 protease family protein [Peziza echinospora]|nr:Ulp1 protease family protein [Peziza echinospora]
MKSMPLPKVGQPTQNHQKPNFSTCAIYRYLEREELIHYPNSKIILLRPSIAYMIQNTEVRNFRGIEQALPPLREASHLFLPINDNPNPAIAEGGSHWSLLVVGLQDRVAFHYDSMMDGNDRFAREVTKKLEVLLNRRMSFYSLPDTPQQDNSSDCGMHVCMTMKHLLLRRLLQAPASQNVDMSMAGKRQDATQGRKDMLKLIEKLRSRAIRSGSPGGKENSPPRLP